MLNNKISNLLNQYFCIYFFPGKVKGSGDYGRIVNERNFERISNYLVNQKVALGGHTDPKELFVHPTILVDVNLNDSVMQEEIFGPVLSIVNLNSVEEAIDFINEREKPLALYVFTKKSKVKKAFLTYTSSGGVVINDTIMHISAEGLPFGGIGNSGNCNFTHYFCVI